jgi:hypothetical protein
MDKVVVVEVVARIEISRCKFHGSCVRVVDAVKNCAPLRDRGFEYRAVRKVVCDLPVLLSLGV